MLGDVMVGLIPVVVPGPLDESRLEFLLVDLARLHSNLNEHLNDALNVDFLNSLAIPLPLDL